MQSPLLSESWSKGKGGESHLNFVYQRIGIYDLPYFFNREIRLIGLAEVFKDQMSKLFSPRTASLAKKGCFGKSRILPFTPEFDDRSKRE